MPKRLIITIVCFHIAAVLIFLCGITIFPVIMTVGDAWKDMVIMSAGDSMIQSVTNVVDMYFRVLVPVMVIGMLLIGVGIELLIKALGKRRYWAWVTAIVLCGLLIVGGHNIVTIILGGLALWGLVDPDTVAAFRPSRQTTDNQQTEV